jgi:hypothetical protein
MTTVSPGLFGLPVVILDEPPLLPRFGSYRHVCNDANAPAQGSTPTCEGGGCDSWGLEDAVIKACVLWTGFKVSLSKPH